ncbi:MAG TPA: lysozyme inhibitor LprI family protein [Pyrinomonadaceae bacterium]|nr:lysozyme inhibitor LprI family protein [Pyrinomonadaceae bacterium]
MKSVLLCLTLIFVSGAYTLAQKKPDPCAGAQSQAEMNICAGKEYKSADAELNQVYQKLSSILNDEEKSQLKEAENAWIRYRDLNCEFVADQYKGGSIRPMIHGLCLADVTRNRTAELRNQIKDRNQ